MGMTYKKLYEDALFKLEHNKITLGEFEEMIKPLDREIEQEPCEDTISRKSIKQKLQEHHDFFVNAYGGFSNLPQNDKSRVDEITNCIAMVVNEPPVTPQEPKVDLDELKQHFYELSYALDSHSAFKEYEELRRTHHENIGWMESKGLEEEYYKVLFEHIKAKDEENEQ